MEFFFDGFSITIGGRYDVYARFWIPGVLLTPAILTVLCWVAIQINKHTDVGRHPLETIIHFASLAIGVIALLSVLPVFLFLLVCDNPYSCSWYPHS